MNRTYIVAHLLEVPAELRRWASIGDLVIVDGDHLVTHLIHDRAAYTLSHRTQCASGPYDAYIIRDMHCIQSRTRAWAYWPGGSAHAGPAIDGEVACTIQGFDGDMADIVEKCAVLGVYLDSERDTIMIQGTTVHVQHVVDNSWREPAPEDVAGER